MPEGVDGSGDGLPSEPADESVAAFGVRLLAACGLLGSYQTPIQPGRRPLQRFDRGASEQQPVVETVSVRHALVAVRTARRREALRGSAARLPSRRHRPTSRSTTTARSPAPWRQLHGALVDESFAGRARQYDASQLRPVAYPGNEAPLARLRCQQPVRLLSGDNICGPVGDLNV